MVVQPVKLVQRLNDKRDKKINFNYSKELRDKHKAIKCEDI